MQKKIVFTLFCMGLCAICVASGLYGVLLFVGVLPGLSSPAVLTDSSTSLPPVSPFPFQNILSSPTPQDTQVSSRPTFVTGNVEFPPSLLFFFAFVACLLFLLCLAVLLSKRLTTELVQPIEAMANHLDHIETSVPFQELRPFAQNIKKQLHRRDQTEKMRQEFTANVSHELKTPLTSISGYAEMLENGMVQEEDIAEFAGKIHNEAGRLIALIGDIIQLAELDEPQPKQEFQLVDLTEIAYRTADLLSLQAERAGVSLSVTGETCLVFGTQKMLDELVYNLCDNAIRYNRNPGSVAVSVQTTEEGVRLSVSDTGIGISKEHQNRIFERFYRVDKSRSKETGGTGLGLAIVKHIALQHHAKIQVSSEENQGTQIYIQFPPPPSN